MRTAYVEIRSIHTKGKWPNRGPDQQISVQIVPDGVEPLKVLDPRMAAKRGIELIVCGVGYWNRTGPNSMYGRGLAAAERLAADINRREVREEVKELVCAG